MDERLQFVARRLAGEAMAELCREFGISRKTGYKIFDRYQECGLEGLTDRSRRPYRYANQLPFQVENYILNVKREHSSWGARKIREKLIRRFSDIPIPAKSTIHAVLDRCGLVERRGRIRRRAQGTALSLGQRPNELWCTDYKGEFLLGNHKYCYPLTDNGRHERMHLTLKKEATKPAAPNFLQQQERFDRFIQIFNNQRPHEALQMKCPAEIYQPSPRPYHGLPDIDYPFHDKTIVVTRCGRICLGHKKINFSQVFAGQAVGIKEVHDDIWLVSFIDYDLGCFDLETRVLEPLENPFGPKVSPM